MLLSEKRKDLLLNMGGGSSLVFNGIYIASLSPKFMGIVIKTAVAKSHPYLRPDIFPWES